MKITIEVIPHKEQRYDTAGDWQFDGEGNLTIRVSDTDNDRMNYLLIRHELDEAMLCRMHGITTEDVDKYDKDHPTTAGNDCFSDNLDSPYHKQHCDALAAEWVLARLLGVNWKEYTERINSLK